jgi:hypothetical protein
MINKRLIIPCKVLLSLLIALALQSFALAQTDTLSGTWRGQIIAARYEPIDIVLHISHNGSTEAYQASLDIPSQHRVGLPVETIIVRNGQITLRLPAIQAEFYGDLISGSAGQQIVALQGDWNQSGEYIPLRFERAQP